MNERMASMTNRFRPVARLGEGGMAEIFLALSNGPAGFNKLVVLKLLREDFVAEQGALEIFLEEARLAAQLEHDNLVHTYETGEFEGRYFIAMEYLQGCSLSQIVRRVPDLPLELRLSIVAKMLAGLHHAHELKGYDGRPLLVVHRDVSPSNIMVTYDGRAKLLDFGIAKVASAQYTTTIGVFKGKMGYSAPEQLRGESVDRRADVFSSGVTLWEFLSGKRLVTPQEMNVSIQRRLDGTEDIEKGAEHVPKPLLAICKRAMALQRDERYATAEEMAQAIHEQLDPTVFRDASGQLGEILSETFAPERTRLQSAIERHVSEAVGASSGALRSVPELRAEFATLTPPSPGANLAPTHVEPVAKRSRWKRLAVAIAFASACAVGLMIGWEVVRPLMSESRHAAPPAASSSTLAALHHPADLPLPMAIASTAPDGSAPAEAATIVWSVEADPPSARLYLDGAPLPSNPFHSTAPKGGKPHVLSARAPGYRSLERTVTFLEPVTLKLSLRRPEMLRSSTEKTQAPDAGAPSHRGSRKELDVRDPWE